MNDKLLAEGRGGIYFNPLDLKGQWGVYWGPYYQGTSTKGNVAYIYGGVRPNGRHPPDVPVMIVDGRPYFLEGYPPRQDPIVADWNRRISLPGRGIGYGNYQAWGYDDFLGQAAMQGRMQPRMPGIRGPMTLSFGMGHRNRY